MSQLPAAKDYHYIHLQSAAEKTLIDSRLAFYQVCKALWEHVETHKIEILGFCLLRNDIHLIVTKPATSLDEFIVSITGIYNDWYNLAHHKRGRLFTSPAIHLLPDAKLLADCINYIHWQPVKENLVATPEIYPWSSHKAYLTSSEWPWVDTEPGLSAIARHRVSWVRRYLKFMEHPVKELEFPKNIQQNTELAHVISTKPTLKTSNINTPQLKKIIDYVCTEYRLSMDEFKGLKRHRSASEARSIVGWLAMEFSTGDIAEIASKINADTYLLNHAINELSNHQLNYLETIKAKLIELEPQIN